MNPLAQIPTLVLADGTVLTESAAITLYLAEFTGQDSLVPKDGDAARLPFLRWLVFLVANVYPTYTYGDDPSRFVDGEEAQRSFKAHVDAYAKKLYGVLEGVAGAPWFLGERFSALDIYLATFLTPLSQIDEVACPQMNGTLRRAFASAREQLADVVPHELWAHRTMMFERHLEWPIRLS